jgi:hypothetical protein
VNSSAKLLNDDDFCRRLPILGQSWERESLSPMQLLSRGIEAGLISESDDPGQAAGDRVMSLAVSRPIETAQSDLLGLAEHTAALADIIVWLLCPDGPWVHPPDETLSPISSAWKPESYLGPDGTLRRVVLCDRWSEDRAIAESFDWRTLEAAIYDMPMTLVVVVLGASRDGRRHGPLSKGYLHPVAQDLRFRKRDGGDWGSTWNPVFREDFKGEREEWLESMTEDGVLEDHLILHQVEVPRTRDTILELCVSKLDRIAALSQADTVALPEPQLGQCFDPIRQCPFRSCCPYFRMPSEANGFIRA